MSKIDPVAGQNGKSRHENGGDLEMDLLIPDDDVADPEVSIVVPAVNEELTISEFVAWCQEGLRVAHVRGEVLIVDSSTDRTAELALAGGARCSGHRNGASDAPILTPVRTSEDATS